MKLYHVTTLFVSTVLLAIGIGGVRADTEAICPVSGHKVTVTDKTEMLVVNGEKQYFCCANCPTAFAKDPGKYIKKAMTCPVMKSNAVNLTSSPRVAINDNLLVVCCGGCPGAIEKSPAKFITELRDPVSKATFKLAADSPHSMYKGVHYFFTNEETKKQFDASPDKYFNKYLSKAG